MLAQAVLEKQRDTLDYTTFVVAVLAFLLGLVNLGWQVTQWRRSGHRVRVTSRTGFVVDSAGRSPLLAIVTAANSGRAPVTLTSFGFELPDGQRLVVAKMYPDSTPLPHRLEAGASAQLSVPTKSLRTFQATRGTPWVLLATGKTVAGKCLAIYDSDEEASNRLRDALRREAAKTRGAARAEDDAG